MGLYLLKYPYRKVLQPLAIRLDFIHPDILSYAATIITIGTAACYYYAAQQPWLLILAVGLTLVRMTLNTMDGVIAIRRGNLSLKGEIVNALPDRYSDMLLVLGIAMSPLCRDILGLLGLASMFLVSYAGMLGKALGVEWQHHGPMGKVERLITVMVFSIVQYIVLQNGSEILAIGGISLTPLEWCMGVYAVLGQVTVYNRLRGMLRQITKKEWEDKSGHRSSRRHVLVAYDSQTGNTAKVAASIAVPLGADLKRIEDVDDVAGYDLVVVGTPNIRAEPSSAVAEFIQKRLGTIPYAAFVTYGMPMWGKISTPMVFSSIRRITGRKPIGRFSCKGFHAKYRTFASHPNEDDLLSAYLFGVRLANRLEV